MPASSTPSASRGRDLQAEFAFALPPSNFTTNSEPVYACFDMLEADNSVAFSADQILSNEPEYAWASQSWSKIFRVWPEAVVEVVGQDQVRRAGGLGGLGDNGTFDMASPADMESGSLTLSRLVACCLRTDTSFTVRSGGHCNAGCSAMNGYVILGVKGLNIVDPRELVVPSRRSESPGTVWVGSGATAGQAAYFTFTESFRTDPDYPARPAPDVPSGFVAGGLPVGQKPTVGVGGLTLGGGFGFHTRFAGLLCDRIVSLTAVRPDTAEEIVATKDNEHSELVWAACGGGGGNYAAITSFTFQMMPVCVVPNCTVIQLEHKMPPTVEALMYFQEWSVRMDTRITANWECASTNLVTIAGIWMGSLDEFEAALVASGLNETTPFTLSDMLASAKEVAYTQAIIDLNGWASVMASGSLFDDYINDRSYFQYVSFFILEPLPDEAMQLLIDEGVQFEANGDFLVYEFQTLGGPPDGSGVPDAGGYVWPNNFSSVDPTSTAFPHRNARHCLMFKAQSATEVAFGPLAVRMRDVYNRVSSYVRGKSPYYNHMDTYYSGVDPYFVDGVDTLWEQGFMPPDMPVDPRYYVDRLSAVRSAYNAPGAMTNVRPVPISPPASECADAEASKIAAIALGSTLGAFLLGAAVFLASRAIARKRLGSASPVASRDIELVTLDAGTRRISSGSRSGRGWCC